MKRAILLAALLLSMPLLLSAIEVKSPKGVRTLRELQISGEAWVCAQELAPAFGGTFGHDSVSQYPVLEIDGKRILVSTHSAVVSVDGKIVRLQHVPQDRDGCLWLPKEFLETVLPVALGGPVSTTPSGTPPAGAGFPHQASGQAPGAEQAPVQVDVLVGADMVRVTLSGGAASAADVKQAGREFAIALPTGRYVSMSRSLGKGIVEQVGVDLTGKRLLVTCGEGFKKLESLKLRNPDRLVLMFKGESQLVPPVSPGEPGPKVETPQGPAVPPAAPAPPPISAGEGAPRKTAAFDVVVLDPGHGGSDTGAISADGVQEKAVTLQIAQRVEAELEKQGIKVVLTRTTDIQVPLTQRTAIANFNQADLFLSIHLNSSPAPSAHGTETYYLSRQATDLWSSQLAEKENTAGGAAAPQDTGVGMVLWQLAQTSSIVESASLAEIIQQEFNTLLGTSDRGVRQAPFAVLEGATMPAVLVEVAFLSNGGEAKRLSDPAFQDQVAGALVKSIISFKARYENPTPQPAP